MVDSNVELDTLPGHAMVAITVIWILAIPTWGWLAYRAATTEHYQSLYADKNELFEMAFGQALTSGLCCPTVPYLLYMAVLGSVAFAFKPAEKSD